MLRLLSRSRRLTALLAAGVLGIAPLAAAPVTHSHPAAASTVPASRVQEIQVELAWMTEPVTFRCQMRARATSSGIELLGCVPSASARKLAVKLAEEACGGKVRDSLRIAKVGDKGHAPVNPDEVIRGARSAAGEVLGAQAKKLEINADDDGQLILSGEVASWQEKHALSSRMRKVAGCSCVVNLLDLPGSMTRTTEEASKKAPRDLPNLSAKPLPTAAAQPAPKPRSVIQRVAAWMSPYGGQTEPAAPDKVIASTTPEKTSGSPIAHSSSSPYGGSNFAATPHSAQTVETVPDEHLPWASKPSMKTHGSVPAKTVLPATMPEPSVMELPTAEPLLPSEELQLHSPPKMQTVPETHTHRSFPMPSKPPQTVAASPLPKAEPLMATAEPLLPMEESHRPVATSVRSPQSMSTSWGSEMPTPMPTPAPAHPSPQPPRPSLFATLFSHSAPAAPRTKVVSQSHPVVPESHPIVTEDRPVVTENHPVVPDRPYVTTGTVIFHDAVPSSTQALPSADGLRQKLLLACGGAAKGVQVTKQPDGSLLVTLQVANESTIEPVTTAVLRLPEMQSTQVHLSYEVAP